MIRSIFAEYVDRVYPSFSRVNEKINGKQKEITYLHKTMLRRVHSLDKKWESASFNNVYVAADMVAMDSPLPIKSRPAVSSANGKLPKVGMLKQMKETEINELDALVQRNANFAEIAKRIMDDALACTKGIDLKNEYNFLYALSHGYVLVEDADNTGVGIRVNYNYPERNTFGVVKKDHVSHEDIDRVLAAADNASVTIDHIAISKTLFDKMRKEQWAREMVANYRGITIVQNSNLPVPTASQFEEAFKDEFGDITFNVIDTSIPIEKNGVPSPTKPFAKENMIFYSGEVVGALVWGDLAEKSHPVEGVRYVTVDEFKLIARFGETNPLREYTSGQALVLPVIEDVDQKFMLNTTIVQPVDDDDKGEGGKDEKITVFGHRYLKSDVVAVANEFGLEVSLSDEDTDIIEAINTLNQSKQGKMKKTLETTKVYFPELNPSAMGFEAAGAAKDCEVTTNATGTITAVADEDSAAWLSATVTGKKVSVTAAANSAEGAAAREGTITVTAGSKTATITVSQKA